MSDVVLTLFCAAGDADAIATTLRDHAGAPVHMRREAVLGWDYDDAATVEHVAGTLDRMAIEVELDAESVAGAIAVVTAARRRRPFRWRTVAIAERGRIE
jgi:hypothetical protein